MKKYLFYLLTTPLLIYSCDNDPEDDYLLSVYPSTINFDQDGAAQEIKISSRYAWNINVIGNNEWCDFSQLSGNGNATVTLTPKPYAERIARHPITCEVVNVMDEKADLIITQHLKNDPPASATLLYPANEDDYVLKDFVFAWEEAIDPDGDQCKYDLLLKPEGEGWFLHGSSIELTEFQRDDYEFIVGSSYKWKVVSNDGFGGSSESETWSFTISDKIYEHGEYRIYQHASATPEEPCYLFITGDGFIRDDYMAGGYFEQWAQSATEAFFSIEPYKTYQDYFTVVFLAAHSEERGCTILEKFGWEPFLGPHQRNTFFNSTLNGGWETLISCDYEKACQFVIETQIITEQDLENITIIILLNESIYAGSCYVGTGYMSVALCPIDEETADLVITHEAGGHGFGRLLDEYLMYPHQFVTQEQIQDTDEWRNGDPWSYAANWSFSDKTSHWDHYLSKEGYQNVGYYQGAIYEFGMWIPEAVSTMKTSSYQYFNAPSREAIVRRIMKLSGQQFDYESFFALDYGNQSKFTSRKSIDKTLPLLPPPFTPDRNGVWTR